MSKESKLFESEPELKVLKEIPLEEIKGVAQDILTLNDAWCKKIDIVGSIRRQKLKINDVDYVVITVNDDYWRVIKESMTGSFGAKVVLSGDQIHRFLIPFKVGAVQVDFYRATEETYGIQKLIRTGSAEHNIYLAKLALRQAKRLLYSKGLMLGDEVIAGKTEAMVFEKLGLKWIPPRMREIVRGEPLWKGKI